MNNPCDDNIKAFENIQTTFVSVVDEFNGTVFCGIFAMKDGYCGNECQWKYNETTKELEVFGNGEMIDFIEGTTPWNDLNDIVENSFH